MKWTWQIPVLLYAISYTSFVYVTMRDLRNLNELAYSTQAAIVELKHQCPTGVEMETLEITTPDGRYTIRVERPVDGLLEMEINEEPGEPAPEPGELAPGEFRLPGHGPKIFTTDGVL